MTAEQLKEKAEQIINSIVGRDEIDEFAWAVIDFLEEQPPQKTGHWIVLTMCANEGIYCSECSTKIFDFVHQPKKKLSQYCPHCGVKMDEHYDPWNDA